MKLELHSIFYSIQGEGFNTGLPAVFIRLSGCNLSCSWCDTDHSCQFTMTPSEIVQFVQQWPARNIVLTGGEPTIQDITPLVVDLRRAGLWVAIETNGTGVIADGIDWITVSPKSPGQYRCDELKVVYTGQDLGGYSAIARHGRPVYQFLQPCSMQNTDEVVRIVKENPTWRLSLQTHKLIGIE